MSNFLGQFFQVYMGKKKTKNISALTNKMHKMKLKKYVFLKKLKKNKKNTNFL